MGRRTHYSTIQAEASGAGTALKGRQQRTRHSLPIFSFTAAVALVSVLAVAPVNASAAFAKPVVSTGPAQSLSVSGPFVHAVTRDGYEVTKKVVVVPPKPVAAPGKSASAPSAGVPNPGSAQAIGHQMVLARGWGEDQYSCLVSLFNRESGWRVNAANPSGAYGIPQALPGSKMASAGADWATNPATQITWGLGYITGRYGTPCGAWAHSQNTGWY
ncbi:MAG: hypothetical protein QOI70_670 [Microbacteriaceae bacterium]|nr:hypothetical protein [Microbacteriaceae bacterium]